MQTLKTRISRKVENHFRVQRISRKLELDLAWREAVMQHRARMEKAELDAAIERELERGHREARRQELKAECRISVKRVIARYERRQAVNRIITRGRQTLDSRISVKADILIFPRRESRLVGIRDRVQAAATRMLHSIIPTAWTRRGMAMAA